jgi:precorrin-6A/cobalt-precorrin-6A reductase
LLRPAWSPVEHDRWRTVPSIEAAPGELTKIGATRVFLAVGRQSAARFAGCEGIWFLARAIEPIGDALPGAHVVLQRGPFALDDELELLAAHRIDTIVAKNSGGLATAAKLDAARRLGLVVVMIERPPQPTALRLDSVEAATHWCAELG